MLQKLGIISAKQLAFSKQVPPLVPTELEYEEGLGPQPKGLCGTGAEIDVAPLSLQSVPF